MSNQYRCERCEKKFPVDEIEWNNNDDNGYCRECYEHLAAWGESMWEAQQEDEAMDKIIEHGNINL